MVHNHVPKEHRPLPLAKNLYDQANGRSIYSSSTTRSKPRYVFSNKNKSKERIQEHVRNLANLQARPSQSGTSTGKGKGRAFVELNIGPLYDPENMIFDNAVSEGHYIEARTFMKHYAKKTKSVDNRNHKLDRVILGKPGDPEKIEGLVLPETSLKHRSTGDPESTTTWRSLYG